MIRTLKYFIANILTNTHLGKMIGWFYNNNIPFNGTIIRTNSPFINPRTKALIFWKLYESSEVQFVKKYLHSNYDVVELGSSIGVVACQIGKKIERTQKLFCVEANPNLLPILKENLVNNNINNARIINVAIALNPEDKNISFQVGEYNTVGKIDEKSEGHPSAIKVDAKPLSVILEENQVLEYSLVCDIEGAEIGILLNDIKSLKNCKQIIIETHSTNYKGKTYTPEDIIKILQGQGFKIAKEHWPNYVLVKG